MRPKPKLSYPEVQLVCKANCVTVCMFHDNPSSKKRERVYGPVADSSNLRMCVYKSRLEHVSLPPLKVISIRLYWNKLHKTIHFNLKDASFSRSLSVTHPDCNNPARHPARSSRGTHTLCLLTALPTLPHIFCLILSFYLFRVFFFSLLSKRDLGQSVKTLNLTPNGSED